MKCPKFEDCYDPAKLELEKVERGEEEAQSNFFKNIMPCRKSSVKWKEDNCFLPYEKLVEEKFVGKTEESIEYEDLGGGFRCVTVRRIP